MDNNLESQHSENDKKTLTPTELAIVNNNFSRQKELELEIQLESKDITIINLKKEVLKCQMQLLDAEAGKKELKIHACLAALQSFVYLGHKGNCRWCQWIIRPAYNR